MFRSPLLLAVGALALSGCFTFIVADGSSPTTQATGPADVLFDESFSVQAGGALAVDLGSEAVVVETVSGDRARVVVEGRGRDAAQEFQRRRFTARTVRGGLEVKTDPPRQMRSRSDAQFTVTVEVPRRFDVAVDLGSGSVSVGGLDGDLSVDTGSGSVSVGAVTGDADVDTGSGSVRVESVSGRLAVRTGSGSVTAGEVDGSAVIGTGSGSVTVTVGSSGPVEVRTGSGSATVDVPQRSDWDVDLDGSSVEIDPSLGFDGRQERGHARGRIGRGGPDLSVGTGSGRIRVRSR